MMTIKFTTTNCLRFWLTSLKLHYCLHELTELLVSTSHQIVELVTPSLTFVQLTYLSLEIVQICYLSNSFSTGS